MPVPRFDVSAPLPSPLYSLPMMLGLSLLLLAVFIGSTLLGAVWFAPIVLAKGELTIDERILLGGQNGTVLGLTTLLSLSAVLVCVWLFIRAKNGHFGDVMAIKPFRFGLLLGFALLLLLLNAIINVVGEWLQREPMAFMDNLVATAQPFWLLAVGMVVVAPIYEEVMFRGFMWSGLAGSKLGSWGASIITSLMFAIIHAQYGMIEWVEIFTLAMLFSGARWLSGSLLLPICLHILNNALAMWQYLGG